MKDVGFSIDNVPPLLLSSLAKTRQHLLDTFRNWQGEARASRTQYAGGIVQAGNGALAQCQKRRCAAVHLECALVPLSLQCSQLHTCVRGRLYEKF